MYTSAENLIQLSVMISVILLTTTVAFVSGVDLNGYQNELDFYGNPFAADAYLSWNPFASPPYSWEQLDVTSDIVKKIHYVSHCHELN